METMTMLRTIQFVIDDGEMWTTREMKWIASTLVDTIHSTIRDVHVNTFNVFDGDREKLWRHGMGLLHDLLGDACGEHPAIRDHVISTLDNVCGELSLTYAPGIGYVDIE
jgi:hypothetical protein